MTKDSFFDFPTSSKSDWIDQVKKDLKGKDFDTTLVKELWDEIKIEPYYTSEELPANHKQLDFNPEPKLPGFSPRSWNTIYSIKPADDKGANKKILAALESGADALLIHLDGSEDLNQLLKGVLTEFIHIYFSPIRNSRLVYSQIWEWLESVQLKPSMLRGAVLWSPTSELFLTGEGFQESLDLAKDMIDRFSAYLEFYPLTLDIARYADAGASGIQQLGFGLGEMIEWMDAMIKKGVSVAMLFDSTAFYASVGELYFPEIAKLKAFRILLLELAANLGQNLDSSQLHFIVSTSTWSKSLIDLNTNLIRQTYEGMAAILGGGNAIWIRDVEEENSDFRKRIARNVSIILKEESYLDKVMDPSAGSYYVENLIENLKTSVLSQLKDLENEGGWLKAFESRKIHEEVRNRRKEIQQLFLDGKQVSVGSNKYLDKSSADGTFIDFEEKEFELKPSRASYLLELKTLKNS